MNTPLHAHDRLPPLPVREDDPSLLELIGGLLRRLVRPSGGRKARRAHHRVGPLAATGRFDRHTKNVINAKVQIPVSDENKEQKVN